MQLRLRRMFAISTARMALFAPAMRSYCSHIAVYGRLELRQGPSVSCTTCISSNKAVESSIISLAHAVTGAYCPTLGIRAADEIIPRYKQWPHCSILPSLIYVAPYQQGTWSHSDLTTHFCLLVLDSSLVKLIAPSRDSHSSCNCVQHKYLVTQMAVLADVAAASSPRPALPRPC